MPFSLPPIGPTIQRSLVGRLAVGLWVTGAVAGSRLEAQPLSPAPFRVVRTFVASTDGGNPDHNLGLVMVDGIAFGTTRDGGSGGGGTLFRLVPETGDFRVIRSITSGVEYGPRCLMQGSDGRLYGGVSRPLTGFAIFAVNRDGSGYTTLHTLAISTEGSVLSGLTDGTDGRLYGVTATAGPNNAGTIFRMNRDGSGFSVLRSLTKATDGRDPYSAMIRASDGRLYGTTMGGGIFDFGTLFRLNADGTGFTVLHHFSRADGGRAWGRLVIANGRIFGTAIEGGAYGLGTIFRVNLDGGEFTVLRDFVSSDGGVTLAGMILGRDGMLYGVTPSAAAYGAGAIYRVNPGTSDFKVLWNMVTGTDGNGAYAELVQAADGRLLGVSSNGGALGNGTIFSFSLAPQLTSPAFAGGTVGVPFTYTIAAADSVGSFSTSELPPGMTLSAATGVISGLPTRAGTYSITVGASNANGATNATLPVTIAKGTATVTLSNLSQVLDGTAKSVTVTTSPAGLPVTTTYNGSTTLPSGAATYNVVSTINDPNYTGSATGTLTISLQPPAFASQTRDQITLAGTAVTLTATLTGSPPLGYQWQRKPAGSLTFAALGNDADFSGATTSTLTVVSPRLAMNGDQFRLVVTNAAGSVTSETIVFGVLPTNRLRNLSVRANVIAGQPLTVGFVSNGGAPTLIVRAIGAGLAPFTGGITLAGDPSLVLFNAATIQVAGNDNWGGLPALVNSFATVGAFPLPVDSGDAALLFVANGQHTAQMRVTTTGLGLVELYDMTNENGVRLIDLSVLYRVGAGADALVAGFVVTGTGTKTLLVRGVGPSLRAFGVTTAIADPKIEVFDGAGRTIATNDDWSPTLASAFTQVGAFSLSPESKDSALLFIAQPGAYTVQLSTVDGAIGQGLLEIYEYPQ